MNPIRRSSSGEKVRVKRAVVFAAVREARVLSSDWAAGGGAERLVWYEVATDERKGVALESCNSECESSALDEASAEARASDDGVVESKRVAGRLEVAALEINAPVLSAGCSLTHIHKRVRMKTDGRTGRVRTGRSVTHRENASAK